MRVLAVLAILAGGSMAAAQDAADQVRKAITAHGGADALLKHKAARLKTKGTLILNGQEIPFTGETTYQLPKQGKNVIEYSAANMPVKLVQTIDGNQVKVLVNGQPRELTKTVTDELRRSLYLQNLVQLVPLLDPGIALSLLPATEAKPVGGREVVGVKVSSRGQADVKMFFDRQTNLLVKVERRGIGDSRGIEGVQEQFYSDYKPIDGVMRPGKTEVFQDGKKILSGEVIEHRHLDQIPASEFE